MNKLQSSLIFRQIIVFVAWFALAIQLYILIDRTPENGLTPLSAIGRFLLFFTILSNLLVATSLTIVSLWPLSGAARFFSRIPVISAITVYIFMVGLVYNIILRYTWDPRGLQLLADEMLHVAVPLLYVIYWLLFIPKGQLKWVHVLSWLIFPLFYVVYALIRGALEGFYPYPFLDVNTLGYTRVFLNAVLLFAVFIITGLLLVLIDQKIARIRPAV